MGKKKQVEEKKPEPVVVKKVVVEDPSQLVNIMEDISKKQAFKKFSWRGKEIMELLHMKTPEFA